MAKIISRSQVMPLVSGGRQVSLRSMHVAYRYSSSGVASNQTKVIFYGITKGARVKIAEATLDTEAGYVAGTDACCVIVDVKSNEYPYMQWEIEVQDTTTFIALSGKPQLGWTIGDEVNLSESSVIKKAE